MDISAFNVRSFDRRVDRFQSILLKMATQISDIPIQIQIQLAHAMHTHYRRFSHEANAI